MATRLLLILSFRPSVTISNHRQQSQSNHISISSTPLYLKVCWKKKSLQHERESSSAAQESAHTCLPPSLHTVHPTRYTRGMDWRGLCTSKCLFNWSGGQTAWKQRQDHTFIHPGGAFDGDINLVLAFIIDVSLTHVSSLWTCHLLLNELRMGTVAVCNKADLVLLSAQTCFLGNVHQYKG